MNARPQGWRRILVTLAAFAACAAWVMPAAAVGDPDESRYFEIEAGPAETRLNEFSVKSELQMIFGFDTMVGVRTRKVRGEYKPLDALKLMVAGTDISFELLNRRTVTLRRPGQASIELQAQRHLPKEKYLHAVDRRSPDSVAMLQEVVISTGRSAPLRPPTGAPYLAISRTEIEESGHVSVPGLIRTIPQIFGGGPTEDTSQIGNETLQNTARGSGINLRGLGAGSTLVLINGRRLAGGGSEGAFVDAANLPLAAVDRIDILPDSASTFYGSDAVGGVVNFVMRDSFNGAQSEGYFGAATKGALNESYVSQILGATSDTRSGLITFDFYSRDALPAADRAQARSDLRAFGGTNFDLNAAAPGTLTVGGQTYAIPRRDDGGLPQPSDFIAGTENFHNRYEGADLLPSQQRWTFFGTAEQKFGDHLALYVDGLVGHRDMRQLGSGAFLAFTVTPANPFYVHPTGDNAPVTVAHNFLRDIGPLSADVDVRTKNFATVLKWVPNDNWNVTATLSRASEQTNATFGNQLNPSALSAALIDPDPNTAFNPFGGPRTSESTLASLRTESYFAARSTIDTASLLVTAKVFDLPGGRVEFSFGGEHRDQSFASSTWDLPNGSRVLDLNRWVDAAFAELRVPLVGPDNAVPGVQGLDISLAERYERYSDFGDTPGSRFGISWKPWSLLTVRGTYADSSKPPSLADLDESTNGYTYAPLLDPTTGRPTLALFWLGKNRQVVEERARSWTAGVELMNPYAPDNAVALTYFDTAFRNRLTRPIFAANILSDPGLAALVTRNPSADLRAEVCSRAPNSGGAPFGCLALPIGVLVDARQRNDEITLTRGLDLLAKYAFDTRLGRLSLGLNGTYLIDFAEAKGPSYPLIDRVSTQNAPIDFRMRASARWERGPFNIGSFVNYSNSYIDTASESPRHVHSWTTVDVQAAYTFRESSFSLLSGMTLSLGVDNLLDKNAPFLNNSVGIGYDQENGDLLGRMVSFSARKKW